MIHWAESGDDSGVDMGDDGMVSLGESSDAPSVDTDDWTAYYQAGTDGLSEEELVRLEKLVSAAKSELWKDDSYGQFNTTSYDNLVEGMREAKFVPELSWPWSEKFFVYEVDGRTAFICANTMVVHDPGSDLVCKTVPMWAAQSGSTPG